jgi:PAS domain S-box-containing protein
MIGYSADELVGQSARVAYESDKEFERVGKVKYSEIQERGVGSVETRFKRKDGSVLDVFLSSSAVNPGDLSKGAIFTVLDITERKKVEVALRESEEKYRILVESSIDGIAIVQGTEMKFVNKALLDMRFRKGKRRRGAQPLRVQGIKAGRKQVRC